MGTFQKVYTVHTISGWGKKYSQLILCAGNTQNLLADLMCSNYMSMKLYYVVVLLLSFQMNHTHGEYQPYIIAHAELYTHNSITIQTVILYCTHLDCSRPQATT